MPSIQQYKAFNDDLSSDGVMNVGGSYGGGFNIGNEEVLELPMEGADIDLCPQKFIGGTQQPQAMRSTSAC